MSEMEGERRQQEMLDAFLAANDLPRIPGVDWYTRLDEYCKGDRLLLMRLVALLLDGGEERPEDLVAAATTLGDIVSWSAGADVGEVGDSPSSEPLRMPEGWPLASNRMVLRPVLGHDIELAYASVTSPHTAWRWPTRGRSIGRGEFEQVLRRGAFVQLVAARRDDHRPIALYTVTNVSMEDGRGEFSVFGLQSGRGVSHDRAPLAGIDGLTLFISYVFRDFGFRKLTAQVPGWNWPQFAGGEGVYFRLEGCMREHDFFRDAWWDRRRIAIFRDEWRQMEPQSAHEFAAIV